jgi:type VI secretion system secreted protein VgrG
MAKVMPRVMELVTPLGDDVLLFHVMSAREEMSRLFEYQLDLLSPKPDVNLDEILGKNVTIKLATADDEVRCFNGYVTRFAQGAMHGRFHRYVATVRPWLWFLTRTSDCRIFQEMTVPDIIKAVFADHPSADFKLELTSTYRKWTYCVQYRETDFNFVSRLLEQEGIAYYFRHTEGHNTLVLTDSNSKHTAATGCEALSYIAPDEQVKPDLEHINHWDYTREIQPGAYVHDDYDLERPSVKLKASKALPRKYTPSDYEVYDYPGEYLQKPDGEQYAGVRIDELGSQFEIAHGTTNARGLSVGSLLTLEDHPRPDQNRDYLILGASYDLSFEDYESLPQAAGTTYRCRFLAMPCSQQFRPQRLTPKPFVQGPQTAVVVGPAGEEIFTDKYGRVKVQFHWDRRGARDDKSSCWIRVSSPWAGKQWGAISIPRIGQEVIVDFLEGDPDQPIITGRVYNAEQMPPYELPGNKTQSGIVSRSSLGGTPENFNELMFEDKKGSELVYLRAEKDYTNAVENDEVRWVGHDRWLEVDHDETHHVQNDRFRRVDHDENVTIHNDQNTIVDRDRSETVHRHKRIQIDGNHSENIDGAMSVIIGKTLTENVLINYAETVGGAMEVTVGAALAISVGAIMSEAVAGAKTESIGGSKTESTGKDKTLNVGKNLTEAVKENRSVTVGKDLKEAITGKQTVEVQKEAFLKAKKIQMTADDEISLITGDAQIILKKNGEITIKGGKITVKGSGDVVVKGSKIAEN